MKFYRKAAHIDQRNKAYGIYRKARRERTITKLPCLICGDNESIAHHEDYAFPLALLWLCSTHHRHIHSWRTNRTDGTPNKTIAAEIAQVILAHQELLNETAHGTQS